MGAGISIEELMEAIQLDEGARAQVLAEPLSRDDFESYRDLVELGQEAFLSQWKKRDDKYSFALAFFLQMALAAYKSYRDQGISDRVYFSTMYDITIWERECYRKYGIHGLEEVLWIMKIVGGQIYRLGRLEFEKTRPAGPLGTFKRIDSKDPLVYIHIPEGERLDRPSCLASIHQARDFYGLDAGASFICESWLLSPLLNEVLDGGSNILAFQELFDLIDWHFKYPQAEKRIYKDLREDKENYPEETSLQRRAKPYFIEGRDFGIGLGLLKDEYIT